MSAHNNNNPSLHQVYQDLMASMTPEDFKVLMCMLRPSQVCFLTQLLPAASCQLQAQDCDTTVASSERDIATQAEEEEVVDSIFAETEMPLVFLPCFDFEDLQDWPNIIVLETASSPLATPSALLCACCNSEELPSAYPAIINWFGIGHMRRSYTHTCRHCLMKTTQ
ncbi:hypothetical protein DSO57_1035867 [Entomophthora muscae]|uniref:Uncharacterized protein n=1 Tax=Entomophthora muscae TaxID=34485 RepID=A0ACC2SZS1_9FUNG|nr:hypothetical protein DSO57_1035867 [Entomophthora muscae]